MQDGSGKSTPLEYNHYAPVAQSVIMYIVHFINGKLVQ